MRERPEWIGKTDDSKPPISVQLRIFCAAKEICAICERIPIARGYEIDHKKAICNGGENRESNLRLVCKPCHKLKTRDDVAERTRVNRKKSKHLGLAPKRKSIQSRGFQKAPAQRTASRPIRERG